VQNVRVICKALVFGLVGCVVTLGVAWARAVDLPPLSSYTNIATWRPASPGDLPGYLRNLWPAPQLVAEPNRDWGMTETRVAGAVPHPETTGPDALVWHKGPYSQVLHRWSFGWPARAVYNDMFELQSQLVPPPTFKQFLVASTAAAGWRYSPWPIAVHPLGFAIDAVLYGAAIACLAWGVPVWRRALRRRANRCERCAYSLVGIADRPCPECGHQRSLPSAGRADCAYGMASRPGVSARLLR